MTSADERLKIMRLRLILKFPFYGFLMTRLPVVKTESEHITTMATDGRKIYYNESFVDSLSDDEILFVLAHEILHNILDHFVRSEDRDPNYWNMATDYAINGWLEADKVGVMPKVGLYKK